METTGRGWRVGVCGWLAFGMVAAAQAGSINGLNNGMPSRLSMTPTTARQTQGATFGEKVATGLQSGANAVASGASRTSAPLVVECGSDACAIVFPDGGGFRADLQALALAPLAPAQAEAVQKQAPAASATMTMAAKPGGAVSSSYAAGRVSGAPPATGAAGPQAAAAANVLGQGASLLGGAMPAGIVSAAVSSVGALANSGGGAAAASYARNAAPAGEVDLSQPLADGDYQLAVVVEKATSGLKDTLKTNVRTAAPPQVRIVVGFSVEDGVLRTSHDTAKNSIGNVR